MAEEVRPPLSDAERDVLKVLWDHGPGTVRQISQHLTSEGRSWSRSTVITLIQRLERKGYAASDQSGFAFVFRARVSRGEFARQQLEQLADQIYEGQPSALVLDFARRHTFTEDELNELRGLIHRLASKRRGRRGKS